MICYSKVVKQSSVVQNACIFCKVMAVWLNLSLLAIMVVGGVEQLLYRPNYHLTVKLIQLSKYIDLGVSSYVFFAVLYI